MSVVILMATQLEFTADVFIHYIDTRIVASISGFFYTQSFRKHFSVQAKHSWHPIGITESEVSREKRKQNPNRQHTIIRSPLDIPK